MMPRSALAAALLCAAPALAAPAVGEGAGATAYVMGRYAFAEARLDEAARQFDVALRSDAQDPALRQSAFELAVAAGDRRQAFRLAAQLDGATAVPTVALTRAVAALEARDWRGYDAALARFTDPSSAQIIRPVLDAWGQAGRGDAAAALARLDAPSARGIARSYLDEHRAQLLARAGRWAEAAEAFTGIVAREGANVPRLRIAAAACLIRAGRRDAAITLLGAGGADDPQLIAARARLVAGRDLADPAAGGLIERPGDGVAMLLLRVAGDLSRDRAASVGLFFARLATFAAPGLPEAWLVTADQLARNRQRDAALDALAQVRDPSFERQTALRRALILAEAERWDDARAALRPFTARADATPDDWARLADIDRRALAFRASADALGRAIALLPASPAPEQSVYWFLRGSALERAGDWRAGEPDLRRAVAMQPDNATYLNYLGYSLLDHGGDLAEAATLVGKALAADPDNGAIIDSAGWVAFRRGRYDEATTLLTKAFAAEPGDPTVADHLGDALWMSGRRIEARSAWAQAQALEPDAALAPRLARKLDVGLDVATRLAAGAPTR